MIVIFNGTHASAPIATLQRPDGSLLDVYEPADILNALGEMIGPVPPEPLMGGAGIFDTVYQEVELPGLSGAGGTGEGGKEAAAGKILLPHLSLVTDLSGLDSALAAAYTAQVQAYNARVAAIQATLVALWPGILAAAQAKKGPDE
jgi:hypothetical protein